MGPFYSQFRRPILSLIFPISAALMTSWGSQTQAQPAVSQAAPCTTPEPKAVQSVGPCVQPCYYFTGFEPEEGFTADAWIGDGNQGASGGIFATWSTLCSQSHGSTSEGHVETANPSSGSQHLRITHDFAAPTDNVFTCVLDARVPSNAVADANTPPIAPTTISVDIAIHGNESQNFNIQPQTRWSGCFAARILFFYYFSTYIMDDPVDGEEGLAFAYAGDWDTTGGYQRYTIHIDPCTSFRCLGGDNPDAPCDSDADCGPNGSCAGRIDYLRDGQLLYQGVVFFGQNMDQLLFYGDNYLGNPEHLGMDIDNVEIIRGDPCPSECGNGLVETGEECEPADRSTCPDRCIRPGLGEPPCTCAVCDADPCSNFIHLDPGTLTTTKPYCFDGLFTFVAEAPAYAIETCGSGFNSHLAVMTGDCSAFEVLATNDDCGTGPEGAGADPLASCFNDPGESAACVCLPTIPGETYYVRDEYWLMEPMFRPITITVSRRLTCDAVWQNGACCDAFGNCADDVAESACNGDYFHNTVCQSVTCPLVFGACCDGSTGECREVTYSECLCPACAWTKDVACADTTEPCESPVIPTISAWGMIILTLLLLVGSKTRRTTGGLSASANH